MCFGSAFLGVATAAVSRIYCSHFVGQLQIFMFNMVLFSNQILVKNLDFIIELIRLTVAPPLWILAFPPIRLPYRLRKNLCIDGWFIEPIITSLRRCLPFFHLVRSICFSMHGIEWHARAVILIIENIDGTSGNFFIERIASHPRCRFDSWLGVGSGWSRGFVDFDMYHFSICLFHCIYLLHRYWLS